MQELMDTRAVDHRKNKPFNLLLILDDVVGGIKKAESDDRLA